MNDCSKGHGGDCPLIAAANALNAEAMRREVRIAAIVVDPKDWLHAVACAHWLSPEDLVAVLRAGAESVARTIAADADEPDEPEEVDA